MFGRSRSTVQQTARETRISGIANTTAERIDLLDKSELNFAIHNQSSTKSVFPKSLIYLALAAGVVLIFKRGK